MSAPCLPVRHNKKRKKSENGSFQQQEEISQPSFDDIASMDAADYLSRVVQQAKSMPDVFEMGLNNNANRRDRDAIPQHLKEHVPIDGSAVSIQYLLSARSTLTPVPTPQHLPGNPYWVEDSLSNFEKLRDYMEDCRSKGIGGKKTQRIPLPPMKDREGWNYFCLGVEAVQTDGEAQVVSSIASVATDMETTLQSAVPTWRKDVPTGGYSPSVRLLMQMDQVMVRRVLSHLGHCVCRGLPLTIQRTAWLYALLARLEKPVHRDDASMLFALLKTLTLARSKFEPTRYDPSGSEKKDAQLARWNLLITLIGIYFEQGAGLAMTVSR